MWLRPTKYAERYKISTRTVWRLIKNGHLTTKKLGATVFILDDDGQPTQLDTVHKKLDEILLHVRKGHGTQH